MECKIINIEIAKKNIFVKIVENYIYIYIYAIFTIWGKDREKGNLWLSAGGEKIEK